MKSEEEKKVVAVNWITSIALVISAVIVIVVMNRSDDDLEELR